MKKLKDNFIKIFIAIIILLTIFRVYLGFNIPLFNIGYSGYDDTLLIDYANYIAGGNWLGTYNSNTLVKGVTYSLLLVVIMFTRIPYSFVLVMLNVLAAFAFVCSIKPIVKNKYFRGLLYIFLIFSPPTFDWLVSQRIYRNALSIPLTLFTLSGFIGVYLNLFEKNKKAIGYGIMGGLSLFFFWNLREDTIWIIPFCVAASFISIISIIIKFVKEKQKKTFTKIVIVVIPWLLFILGNFCICTINYAYYGVFTSNDRTKGEFADLISLMIKIDYEDDESVDTSKCIVSRKKLEYIIDNSESLSEFKDTIMSYYIAWAGDEENVNGDLFVWAFRGALTEKGYYDSATKISDFCKQVNEELEEKIDNGEMSLSDGILLSSSTRMFHLSDIPNLLKETVDSIKLLGSYETASAKFIVSNGTDEEIREMERLTNSFFLQSGETDEGVRYNKVSSVCVDIANNIISVYQKISIPLFIITLVLYVILTICQIINIKVKDLKFFKRWIILTGILLSYFLLVGAVTYFITWIENYKQWQLFYTSSSAPLLQIFQLFTLYVFVSYIIDKIKKRKGDNENENSSTNTMLQRGDNN